AADELLVDQAGGRRKVALAPLVEEEGEEVDLEEEVAELVEQLLVVTGERGVRDLVGLLDRVRHDRLRRLLAIPRAVAAQPLCQPLQVEERLLELSQWWSSARWCRSTQWSAHTRPGSGPSSRSSSSRR